MFDIFKKRKLVGNVPAQVRLSGGKVAVFHYMLYVKGSMRVYDVEFTHNKQLLDKYFKSLRLKTDVRDFICRTHKLWHETVKPWLDGEELGTIYQVDNNRISAACQYIKH